MEREIDKRIGAASVVMQALNRSVMVTIYLSIYVSFLTYGHQRWVMTERTRSRIQAAEMSFLRRVAGLSLRDRLRSLDIREGLGVEPLLLHIERSQLGWLGHLDRMPSGHLPLEVFRTCPTKRRPRGRPRSRWRDYICRLSWEQLGVPPGGADGSGWGEGCLGIPPEAAAPATQILVLMATSPAYFRGFTLIALKEGREGTVEDDYAGQFQVSS
ncbi:Spondin-1 F-spondin [Takifugu flavidus]|uniref:Spondin-1 F-spondin n=1 Tax=Takifugu flavidus TaxID=433684 RepID=A0A5C6PD75_9TELE|nr:Spondin-1 F-spondin [Takifugu flavidus]